MMLVVDSVVPGKPRPDTRWDFKSQKSVVVEGVDYKKRLIDSICEPKLNHITNNLPDSDVYHSNYLTYLERCWADHLGIVVSPDIIWYTLLCELANIVKASPENYRRLFTDSTETKDILIQCVSLDTMPLSLLIEALKDLVPTNTDAFLPEFSTSTLRSQHAFNATFCDMCSPYYNYMMYCCGFPYIDVRGTVDDWQSMAKCWIAITKLFNSNPKWFAHVNETINSIISNVNNLDFWKKMFYVEKCGSGSDVEMRGWFTDLFWEQPSLAKSCNFATHISEVNYEQIQTKKKYKMKVGLLFSKLEDALLIPNFGYVVYEGTQ